MAEFPFHISGTDGEARTGRLSTPRGDIATPAFMPVGTAGTVKAMFLDDVRSTGTDIILGNTYHLMLRPSAERVQRLGGLHRFMGWSYPILTDSGGFRVFALRSAQDERGGRRVPLAYRRLISLSLARAIHRNPVRPSGL